MINQEKLDEIYADFDKREDTFISENAFQSAQATRRKPETRTRFRSAFGIDRDRILYSGSYRRYQGKTQVFSFTNQFDEEMSNRSLHTTYVSQIARTIGRVLRLNLELIEAIALGHDLGHTPFGHDGERALSDCCQAYGLGHFHHNIESLQIVDNIARKGTGMNLTFQVRDGIISHDGEVHNTQLKPQWNKTEEDIVSYSLTKKEGKGIPWMPATLEGCVVRISDTIAYIGQDIEDAIRYNILTREELPDDCVEYFGTRNSTIIDVLVKSVIAASYGQDFIAFDDDTSNYLLKLKRFNYDKIYTNPIVKNHNATIQRSMRLLFEKYINDLNSKAADSRIFSHFLNHKADVYLHNFNNAEKVRDFIASMTDRYFYEEVKHYLLPGRIDIAAIMNAKKADK